MPPNFPKPKSRRPVPALLLGFLILAAGCGPQFRHQDLSSYQPRFATTAHHFLEIERELGSDAGDFKLLDDVLQEAKESLEQGDKLSRKTALYDLKIIYYILEQSFGYTPERLLNTGFKDNLLDCDLLAAVYVSIGEVLDLPIRAVVVPGHAFVRWELAGGKYLNWETTRGRATSDGYYLSGAYRVDPNTGKKIPTRISHAAKNGVYMRTLSNGEFLAVAEMNAAFRFLELFENNKKNRGLALHYLSKAAQYFDQALASDPKRVGAYWGLYLVRVYQGRQQEAMENLDRLLKLYPDADYALSQRGRLRLSRQEYDLARRDFEKAYKVNPANREVAQDLAITWDRLGNKKKSREWLEKALAPE